MATVAAAITYADDGTVLITWEAMATGDDGDPVNIGGMTDLTVHSDGDYDGETFAMQGSNNNTAWFPLTAPGGAAITLADDGDGFLIVEEPKYIRPLADGGGTTVDVDIWVQAKRRGL